MADLKEYRADVINDFGDQLCKHSGTFFPGRSKDFLARDCVCCVYDEMIHRAFAVEIITDIRRSLGEKGRIQTNDPF